MSAIAVRPLSERTVSSRRRVGDRVVTVFVWLSVAAAIVPLGLVLVHVTGRGVGVLGREFFTGSIPTTRSRSTGMAPAIVGTLLITGAATAISVPLGVMAAVYVSEYGERGRMAGALRFLADVMAGVPSIITGLFVYTIWVLRFGQSALAGALALSCLMLPLVIRASDTAFSLVPRELREASYALGAGTARTAVQVVLPAALPGVVSGSLLAIARAAGETAPLLFTIGTTQTLNTNLFGGTNTALSTQIFGNAQQPFPGAQARAWGAALTLVLVVVALSAAARFLSARLIGARR